MRSLASVFCIISLLPIGAQNFLPENTLSTIIDEINSQVSNFTMQVFRGNKLALPSQELSEVQSFSNKIPLPNFLNITQTGSRIRSLYFNNSLLDLNPTLLRSSDPELPSSILIEMEVLLSFLPPQIVYEESDRYDVYTTRIYLQYIDNFDSENRSRLNFNNARIEMYGIQAGSSQRITNYPGEPILVWPREATKVTQSESQLLIGFRYDSQQNLSEVLTYRYDFFGNFYELEQETEDSLTRFLALDDANLGFRELLTEDDYSVLSVRNFDDKGRLISSSLPKASGTSSHATRNINYLDDGGREEIAVYVNGEKELNLYNPENKILESTRNYPNGRREIRKYSYTEEGEILLEEYRGTLGTIKTEYEYKEGELAKVTSTRNGIPTRILEIEGEEEFETRYLRGEPVLRIYSENGLRVREEEIFQGRIIREREYFPSEETLNDQESEEGTELELDTGDI